LTIAKKSLVIFVTTTIIRTCEIVVFFVATSRYSPTDFGSLTIARSFFAFFVLFSDMNLYTVHVKKTAESVEKKNVCFSTYLSMKAVLVPCTAVMFFIVMWIDPFGSFPDSCLMNNIMLIVLFTSILNSINMVFLGTFHAEMNVTKLQTGIVVGSVLKVLLTLLLVEYSSDFIYYVSIFLFYEIFILTVNLVLSRKMRLVRVNIGHIRGYMKIGGILLASNIMSIVYSNLGVLLLGEKLGMESIGVYYVISRLVAMLSIVQVSFQTFLLPDFSKLLSSNDIKSVKRKTELFQKYSMIMWGMTSIAVIGFGKYLLEIIGAAYVQGYQLICVEALYMIAASWIPYHVIMISDETPRFLLLPVVLTISSFLSWFLLPELFGMLAIEFGRYIALVPNVFITVFYAYKRYGIGKPSKDFFMLISIVVSLVVIEICLLHYGASFVISTSLLLLIFAVALMVTKILKKEDLQFVKSILKVNR